MKLQYTKSVNMNMNMKSTLPVSGIMLTKFAEIFDEAYFIVFLKEFHTNETEGDSWKMHEDFSAVTTYCGHFRCKIPFPSHTPRVVMWIGVGDAEQASAAALSGKAIAFNQSRWNELCELCCGNVADMAKPAYFIHRWHQYYGMDKSPPVNASEIILDSARKVFKT